MDGEYMLLMSTVVMIFKCCQDASAEIPPGIGVYRVSTLNMYRFKMSVQFLKSNPYYIQYALTEIENQ